MKFIFVIVFIVICSDLKCQIALPTISNTSVSASKFDNTYTLTSVSYKIANSTKHPLLFSKDWIERHFFYGKDGRKLTDKDMRPYFYAHPIIPPSPYLDTLIEAKKPDAIRILNVLRNCNSFEVTDALLFSFSLRIISSLENSIVVLQPGEHLTLVDRFLVKSGRSRLSATYQLQRGPTIELESEREKVRIKVWNCRL